MREIGKLFQRDRYYWLLFGVAVFLLMAYWTVFLAQNLGRYTQYSREISEQIAMLRGEYGEETPEEEALERDRMNEWLQLDMDVVNQRNTMDYRILYMLCVFLLVNWAARGAESGMEAEERLPIGQMQYVTYDILCGMIQFGVPFALADMIFKLVRAIAFTEPVPISYRYPEGARYELIMIWFFCFSLAVLGRQVSKSILGCMFFALVNMLMFVGVPIFDFFQNIIFQITGRANVLLPTEGITAGFLSICVFFLCYLARRKRDLAAGGTYFSRVVHYLVLAELFGIVFYACANMGGLWINGWLSFGSIVRSGAIAAVLAGLSHLLLWRRSA